MQVKKWNYFLNLSLIKFLKKLLSSSFQIRVYLHQTFCQIKPPPDKISMLVTKRYPFLPQITLFMQKLFCNLIPILFLFILQFKYTCKITLSSHMFLKCLIWGSKNYLLDANCRLANLFLHTFFFAQINKFI